MFFVDLDGHIGEERIQKAITRLKDECEMFKILGSYPKSNRIT
jgi:prephenate dehydratase